MCCMERWEQLARSSVGLRLNETVVRPASAGHTFLPVGALSVLEQERKRNQVYWPFQLRS